MRRLRTTLLILFVPLALVLGVWLGGHPDWLPGFARDTLGRRHRRAPVRGGRRQDRGDYYRKVDRDQLLDTSLGKAVESLDDQFSHYFSPKDYHAFQLDTEGAVRGRRDERDGGQARACAWRRSTTARRPRRAASSAGTSSSSVNGKPLKGKSSEESTTLIKGPAGTEVTLGLKDGRDAQAQARQGGHPDRAERDQGVGRQEDRVGAARGLHVRLRRRRQTARSRRSSRTAPRASCSTCATTAAAC